MRKILLILLALAAGTASAEMASLADPTRPSGVLAPLGGDSADVGEVGRRLQSVLNPSGGKPTAIISGQVVPLGGKIGDARLVKLSETEAVLKGPKGLERLALTPDVTKKNEPLKAGAMDKRNKP